MTSKQEGGGPVTDAILLGYIRASGGKYLNHALATGAECGCGNCHLCVYRYAEKRLYSNDAVEPDGLPTAKLPALRELTFRRKTRELLGELNLLLAANVHEDRYVLATVNYGECVGDSWAIKRIEIDGWLTKLPDGVD